MGLKQFFADVRGDDLPAGARAPIMRGENWAFPARHNRMTRIQLDEAAEASAQEREQFSTAFEEGYDTARGLSGQGEVGAQNMAQLDQTRRDFKLGQSLASNANPTVAAQGQTMMREAYAALNPHLEDIETRAEQITDRLDTQEFGMFKDERNAMQKTLGDAQARLLARDDQFNNFASQMENFKSGSALSETAIAEYLGTSIEEAGGLGGSLELLGLVGGAAAGGVGARTGRAAGALLERMVGGEKLSNDEALKLASALLSAQKLANGRIVGETSQRLAQHDAYGVERGWLKRESFRTDQYPLTAEEARMRSPSGQRPTTGGASDDGEASAEMPTTREGLEALAARQPGLEAEAQREGYSLAELSNSPATQLPPTVAQGLALVESERGELRYEAGEGNKAGKLVDGEGREVDVPPAWLSILADRMRKQRQRAREVAGEGRAATELGGQLLTPKPPTYTTGGRF